MAITERGKKYVKLGATLVLIVGGIEVARRMRKSKGPRKQVAEGAVVAEEDVGWAEQPQVARTGGGTIRRLSVGDQVLVVEVVCFDDACTKVDGPIGLAQYEVTAVGADGVALRKGRGYKSMGPKDVSFLGDNFAWANELEPFVRRVIPAEAPEAQRIA